MINALFEFYLKQRLERIHPFNKYNVSVTQINEDGDRFRIKAYTIINEEKPNYKIECDISFDVENILSVVDDQILNRNCKSIWYTLPHDGVCPVVNFN